MVQKNNFFVIIRNSFSKIWNKQFLIFFLFLCLSASFWVFQTLNETYEQEYQVPLRITNLPKDVVITGELPENLTVSIRDKGITLLNYRYGEGIPPINIDFNAHANKTGHVHILTRTLTKQLSSRLATGSNILSIKPDTIDYFYNHGLHKRIPLHIKGDVETEAGYSVVETTQSSDSVTVYASGSILESIDAAYIHPNLLQSLSADVHTKLPIQPIRGAKFIPDSVEVTWKVERMVEKAISVAILPEGFPKNKRLLPIPQDVEVRFHVSMNNYRDIDANDFKITVNYNDLPTDGSSRCALRIVESPKNVSKIRIAPKEVEYIIEEINAQ